MPEDAQAFSVKEVPYVEVEVLTDFDQVMRNVLSGTSCLFIEGRRLPLPRLPDLSCEKCG